MRLTGRRVCVRLPWVNTKADSLLRTKSPDTRLQARAASPLMPRSTSARSDAEEILTLRCYAIREGDTWEAICVDLDISTFASSLDEVKTSLVTSIELFLEGVAEASPEDRRLLLRRRSPWHLGAKLAALTWLSRRCNGACHALQFTLQSSVPAHT